MSTIDFIAKHAKNLSLDVCSVIIIYILKKIQSKIYTKA